MSTHNRSPLLSLSVLAIVALSSAGWLFDTWSSVKGKYVADTVDRIVAGFPNKPMPRDQLTDCLAKEVEPAFEALRKHCSASEFKSLLGDAVEYKIAREKGAKCAVAIELAVEPTNSAIEVCLSRLLAK